MKHLSLKTQLFLFELSLLTHIFFFFLYMVQQLQITFRRDPSNYRPRINKLNSVKDSEQKKGGHYFYGDE